jgi:NCAIR mutase (PurE)-related protein
VDPQPRRGEHVRRVSTHPEHDRELRHLLAAVRDGQCSIDQALVRWRSAAGHADAAAGPEAPGELGFATIDHDRNRRCGFPEVVFCQGKTPTDAAAIAIEILSRADRLLMTRATFAHAEAVRQVLPQVVWHERARCLTVAPASPWSAPAPPTCRSPKKRR